MKKVNKSDKSLPSVPSSLLGYQQKKTNMTSSSFCVVYIPEVLLINEKTRQILDI